uniref:Putative type III restriction enzyme n=1 Tax=viral metagenome TaxID=1070528 RepID=A0A6M3K172_9ZZZZ
MTYGLRPYQQRAVEELASVMRAGVCAPLLVAATGSGKTVVACHVIEEQMAHRPVLFLAHRAELIAQCSAKLAENGIRHGIIKAGMDRGGHGERVQVASVQTFARRLRNMRHDYGLVIVDEAHHAPANTYQQIIAHCSAEAWFGNGSVPAVIGLTATPYRTDGAPLGNLFDRIVKMADMADLISGGYLVTPRLFRGKARIDLAGLAVRNGDYEEGALGERMRRPALIGHAVAEYLRLAVGGRGVAFCASVRHSRYVAEAFNVAGVRAEHLDGETPDAERAAILARFRSSQTRIVANCGVLTEGYDEPRIQVILAMRPTMSRCLWRQMCGRGLRPCPEIGKAHVLLLDHAQWTDRHGYLTDPDHYELETGLLPEMPGAEEIVCRACGAQLRSRPPFCPQCGARLTGDGVNLGIGDASQLAEDWRAQAEERMRLRRLQARLRERI